MPPLPRTLTATRALLSHVQQNIYSALNYIVPF